MFDVHCISPVFEWIKPKSPTLVQAARRFDCSLTPRIDRLQASHDSPKLANNPAARDHAVSAGKNWLDVPRSALLADTSPKLRRSADFDSVKVTNNQRTNEQERLHVAK
jgi:hypothetical protein